MFLRFSSTILSKLTISFFFSSFFLSFEPDLRNAVASSAANNDKTYIIKKTSSILKGSKCCRIWRQSVFTSRIYRSVYLNNSSIVKSKPTKSRIFIHSNMFTGFFSRHVAHSDFYVKNGTQIDTNKKKIKHVDFCILRTWAYFEGLKYNKFTPKWSALHRMNRKKRKC